MSIEESMRIKKIKFTKLQGELELQLAKEKKGIMDNNGEIFNENEISKQSILNICLLEARNLPSSNFQGLSNPYVILKFEGQEIKSSLKNNSLDPVWNENFLFTPFKKSSILELEVWGKGNFMTSDSILGKTKIFLQNYDDQQKTNILLEINKDGIYKEINLNNDDNSNTDLPEISSPYISINLHFIYNKFKYYTDNFNRIEGKIQITKQHITELNYYCETFNQPFGLIIHGEIHDIIEKRFLDKEEDAIQSLGERKDKLRLTSPRMTHTKYTFTNKLQNVIKSTLSKLNIRYINQKVF
jgi:hypothetical protein